jgi:enamine deaminase RidA (YjgF/YER057c/UK114 family)
MGGFKTSNFGEHMNYDEKIEELFIDLPEPPIDKGGAVGVVKFGKLILVGGMLPLLGGKVQQPGRVGVEVRLDNAKLAARTAAVMALAYVRKELGGTLNNIKRLIKVDGYVACGADFKDHAKVIDGASELFTQIFGPSGKHVRTAVGVSSLPENSCVELSVVFEVK